MAGSRAGTHRPSAATRQAARGTGRARPQRGAGTVMRGQIQRGLRQQEKHLGASEPQGVVNPRVTESEAASLRDRFAGLPWWRGG